MVPGGEIEPPAYPLFKRGNAPHTALPHFGQVFGEVADCQE
jgi:hypothetical protein